MNKNTKIYIFCGVVLALLVGVLIGYKLSGNQGKTLGSVTVGTTNSTQRIAQIVLDGNAAYDASANRYVYTSSTTPICNNDTNDRTITYINYAYTALAQVSTSTASKFTLQAATSSSNITLAGNTNYVLNTLVATSSPYTAISSTTPGLTATDPNRQWPSGSCIAIQSNATTSSPFVVQVGYIAE